MNTEATPMDAIEERIEAALSPEVPEEAPIEETVAPETEEVVEDSPDTPDGETDATEAQAEEDLTVAEFLGIPDDRIIEGEDGTIQVAVKVDGKTMMVSPGTLVENYQREAHANAKSMEASETLKKLNAQREQQQAEYAGKLEQAEIVIATAGKQLADKYANIDWQTLEINDPGQAALLRQKIQDEAQGVAQQQHQLMQARQQHAEQQNELAQQQQQEFLQDQMSKVIQANPTWNDEKVREREFGEIKDYLTAAGADEQAISGVTTAMQVDIIRKAMLYDAGKKQASPKLAKAVPKFQKAGKRSPVNKQKSDYQKKRARLRKSGSSTDLASVLQDIL